MIKCKVHELIARLRFWSNDPGDELTLGDEPPIPLMQTAADRLTMGVSIQLNLVDALTLTTDALEVALEPWSGAARIRGDKLIKLNKALIATVKEQE